MDKKNTHFYDIIRVIATIFVVLGHATYSFWNSDSGYIILETNNVASIVVPIKYL